METVTEQATVSITAKNIGGIERTTVDFDPGTTLLVGQNATHRTSFLQAIMAGLGSEQVSLKGDAEDGNVRLEIGDETYTRELHRENGSVRFSGDPYLEDSNLADRFAFLLGSNEARRTVAAEGDLREIIMGMVDFDAIEAEIELKKAEKRKLSEQIEALEEKKAKLPDLEAKRTRRQEELKAVRDELAESREALDTLETDAGEARVERRELDDRMDELHDKESDLDTVEFQLESQADSLETLKEELEELEQKQAELTPTDDVDVETLEADLQSLRDRKQALSEELNKLQTVIQFNEEMLDGTSEDIAAALRDEDTERDRGNVTNRLVEDDEPSVCWTCGADVERRTIEDTLDQLRELRQPKFDAKSDVESEIEDVKARLDEIESQRAERTEIEDRLAEVKSEIAERESRIEELEERREQLIDDIESLNAEIEDLEREDRSKVLKRHREVNDLEVKLERLESEVDEIEAEIETIESEAERIDDLETRKTNIQEELADLRTRVEQIENKTIEKFNEHMGAVLEVLEYDNIERIWIERTEREEHDGRRKVTRSTFDLHVVRSTDEGVTYEDDFSHLSESEREVTGLVFALSGYLAHDVYEEIPFILLDSLEAIDADRIAKLIEYLQDFADYLVAALLVEDADALTDEYRRIEEI